MERLSLPVLFALLLCVYAAASPAFYCPEDCTCVLSQNTHKPLLHAKCNSTKGLQLSEQPLRASIPIHSIDLSYLGLTRVEHVLDMLPNLTSVDLSHNELHEIGHLNKRIKKLNLKHNRLTSAKLLKLPQHLQLLNLQHNDITNLPMELKHLHHLQQLELGHNSINCSCSTLEVRNWLQERHVYMEKPVICSHPVEARGKPWLQVKQSEVCDNEQRGFSASELTDENELMMGDQPMPDWGEQGEEEEELGKDFLVIDDKRTQKSVPESPPTHVESDVEGSGDLTESNMELLAAKPNSSVDEPKTEPLLGEPPQQDEQEMDDEGSGSGGGMLVIPAIESGPISTDDFEPPDSAESGTDHNDYDDTHDNKPLDQPATPSADIFKNIGIFEDAGQKSEPVSEETIVPAVHTLLDADVPSDVVTDGPLDSDKTSDDILAAKIGKNDKDDSNAIYYLMGVIALIVVGLILFVAIKRCKYNSNAAARDAEAQRQTELLEMDKKALGKPLARNGHEHAPLIGEKTKLNEAQITKKPYDSKDNAGQQPLLNGNGAANGDAKDVPKIVEPVAGEAAPHEYYPITPRYPTPQSPRASKYSQHPQGVEQNNNNEPDGAYLPSSPKSGRYSPVYSPETGRVKIKLTETPKPKTPMLVTRSKSNAGDIITTPISAGNSYLEPTHQVNGIAGH